MEYLQCPSIKGARKTIPASIRMVFVIKRIEILNLGKIQMTCSVALKQVSGRQ
jgi:hypothetical protein